jgi:putative ATP-dependent endonuclease of OLD family
MKISKINIHNFRSIFDLEIFCESLVVFLGPNNCGKSNILNALEFFLQTSYKISENDFCQFMKNDDCMFVELTFDKLTNQEKITFKKYLLEDETICIRKTAEKDNNSIITRYNGYTYEPTSVQNNFFILKGESQSGRLVIAS